MYRQVLLQNDGYQLKEYLNVKKSDVNLLPILHQGFLRRIIRALWQTRNDQQPRRIMWDHYKVMHRCFIIIASHTLPSIGIMAKRAPGNADSWYRESINGGIEASKLGRS